MSAYRQFAPQEATLCETWSKQPFCADHVWTLGDPVGIGEAQSIRATDAGGLSGFAKPAFYNNDMPRAAHEKIASDLAFLAGFPVPPVILWAQPDTAGLFSISAKAFKQPINWDQAQYLLSPETFVAARKTLAVGYIFHTWIGDQDHNGNGGNVVIDALSAPDNPALAFIDHAFSMSYGWLAVSEQPVPLTSYYGAILDLPHEPMRDAIARIQGLSDGAIDDIVSRIPSIFLPVSRVSIVIDSLKRRRDNLPTPFRALLEA